MKRSLLLHVSWSFPSQGVHDKVALYVHHAGIASQMPIRDVPCFYLGAGRVYPDFLGDAARSFVEHTIAKNYTSRFTYPPQLEQTALLDGELLNIAVKRSEERCRHSTTH